MTERYYPFDDTSGVNEDDYRTLASCVSIFEPGVLRAFANELAAFGDSTGMHVTLPTGAAGVYGHVYINDSPLQVPIADNASGDVRWDRLVIHFDYGQNTVHAIILQGNNNPAGPPLTQDRDTRYHLHVAFIKVENGANTIASDHVFLAHDRYGRGIGDSPIGVLMDFMLPEAAVPPGWALAAGQRADWHYFPKLHAAGLPTWTGTTGNACTFGFDPATTEIVFPDARYNVLVGKDDMGGAVAARGGPALNGEILGSMGGAAVVGLTAQQIPPHLHGINHAHPTTATDDPSNGPNGGGNWHIPGTDFAISQNVVPISDGDSAHDTWMIPEVAWMFAVGATTGHAISGNYVKQYHLDLAPISFNVPLTSGLLSDAGVGLAGAVHNNIQPSLIVNKIVRVS